MDTILMVVDGNTIQATKRGTSWEIKVFDKLGNNDSFHYYNGDFVAFLALVIRHGMEDAVSDTNYQKVSKDVDDSNVNMY